MPWSAVDDYAELFCIARQPVANGLSILGLDAGVIMAIGSFVLQGVFRGIDSWNSALWYINYIGQASALGWLILYPIWCIFLGLVHSLK